MLATGLSLRNGLPIVRNRLRLRGIQGASDRIDVECSELPTARSEQCRHVDAAFTTDQEVARSRSEPVTLQPGRVSDSECHGPVWIRRGARAMPTTKAALTGPHGPLRRLLRCAQSETDRTAMAAAFEDMQRRCHGLYRFMSDGTVKKDRGIPPAGWQHRLWSLKYPIQNKLVRVCSTGIHLAPLRPVAGQ